MRGLIPACAGKTYAPHGLFMTDWAHPRVCGENVRAARPVYDRLGSSPRVRGKPKGTEFERGFGGLIPACAGKTNKNGLPSPASPAHPRVCGENASNFFSALLAAGSSPRVRGKPQIFSLTKQLAGLIPACAGKTPWMRVIY